MKKLQIFAALAIYIFTALTAVKAQTTDQIIKKYLDAIGGTANWKKINSIISKGTIYADHQEYSYYNTVLNKKGEKKEFSAGGMTAYELITEKKGWAYVPQFGLEVQPEAIPDIVLRKFSADLDIQGPLIDSKAKGVKISYTGKEKLEDTVCYKLEVIYPNGRSEIMYIDTVNYYHIGSGVIIKEHGEILEQHSTKYWNFKKLPEGIVVPMGFNVGDGPVALDSVEINQPVDIAIFDPFNKKTEVHY